MYPSTRLLWRLVVSLIHKTARAFRSTRAGTAATEQFRARRFVGTSFRGPRYARRAWIPWAGLDVWEIIEGYKPLGYKNYVAHTGVSEAALDLALDYYEAYQDEIDDLLEDNDRTLEEWEALYPGVISSPR